MNRSEFSSQHLIFACIVLVMLGLGVRLLVWQFNRAAIAPVMSGLTSGYKDNARVLARGDLGLFIKGPNPPSDANVIAHPPGYSILIAMIFSLFGESDFAIRFLQILSDAMSVVFVFLIALELTSKRVAIIAGVLAALSPQLAYNSLLLLPDSLSVLPILIAVFLFVRARNRNHVWIKLTGAGAMLALSCWLRPNGILLPVFFAALIPILFERGRRVRVLIPIAGAAVLLIAPLTIRNYIVFDRFIPISLGSGVTMIEGIADYDTAGATELKRTDVEVLQEEATAYNRPEYAGSLFNPDGTERERGRIRQGISAIQSRPFWFLGVMIRRAASMLRLERVPAISGSPLALEAQTSSDGNTTSRLRLLSIILKAIQKLFITAIILPLALIGLFILIKHRRKNAIVILLAVPIYFMCIQSFLHTEYRYVLAIHYFLLVLVATSVNSITRTTWHRARGIKGRTASIDENPA